MEKILSIIINLIDKFYHQRKINKILFKFKLKVVFDIGAHKGEFLQNILTHSKLLKIYAFEPQYEIFQELKKNFNKLKNVFIHNKAMSNIDTRKKLRINLKTSTSTFSKYNKNSYWRMFKEFLLTGSKKSSFIKSEIVKTTTLDNFCKKNHIKNIDLLKIDTEGHELEVLFGGKKTLKNNVKYLLIEIHRSKIYKNYKVNNIEKFLLEKKFILIKKFKFPFLAFEDRIYKKIN